VRIGQIAIRDAHVSEHISQRQCFEKNGGERARRQRPGREVIRESGPLKLKT
jgi:hypothetical protein